MGKRGLRPLPEVISRRATNACILAWAQQKPQKLKWPGRPVFTKCWTIFMPINSLKYANRSTHDTRSSCLLAAVANGLARRSATHAGGHRSRQAETRGSCHRRVQEGH